MTDINNVSIIGRLTRDAELNFTAGGNAVCKFSIAVNRSRKSGDHYEEEANFFTVVVWGRQAESLNQYLLKGKQVAVSGELRQERWQQDGQNRYRIDIIANTIQLLGGAGNSSKEPSEQREGTGQSKQPPKQRAQSYQRQNADGFTDDIPF